MQRDEANSLLENISDNFCSLFPIAIGLLPQDTYKFSEGFEIHIFAYVDETRLSWLKSMVKERNLQLRKIEDKSMLIIY